MQYGVVQCSILQYSVVNYYANQDYTHAPRHKALLCQLRTVMQTHQVSTAKRKQQNQCRYSSTLHALQQQMLIMFKKVNSTKHQHSLLFRNLNFSLSYYNCIVHRLYLRNTQQYTKVSKKILVYILDSIHFVAGTGPSFVQLH